MTMWKESWHKGTRHILALREEYAPSPLDTIPVKEVVDLHTFCPSQWLGRTISGHPFYVRFRHDWLEMRFGDAGAPAESINCQHVIGRYQLSDDDDGIIEWEEVCAIFNIVIEGDLEHVIL